MIAERPAGTDRQGGGRRSLSSAGEARWRLRRRRPIEKRRGAGGERSGEISASLSTRVAPGLHTQPWPAIHPRFPAPPTTGHRRYIPAPRPYPASKLDLSIHPSSADESDRGGRRAGASQQGSYPPILHFLLISMVSLAVAHLLNC